MTAKMALLAAGVLVLAPAIAAASQPAQGDSQSQSAPPAQTPSDTQSVPPTETPPETQSAPPAQTPPDTQNSTDSQGAAQDPATAAKQPDAVCDTTAKPSDKSATKKGSHPGQTASGDARPESVRAITKDTGVLPTPRKKKDSSTAENDTACEPTAPQ